MNVKKDLFARLDAICDAQTVFATNTSSLSVTEIASAVQRGDKVAGMHFFNPAPVMKLVEVIRAKTTSDETVAFVRGVAESVGKQPCGCERGPRVCGKPVVDSDDQRGRVGILADGVASAADIDKAMKLGANHPIGPLALADLIGNDVNLAILQAMHRDNGKEKYRPHPLLVRMVQEGKLGKKTGQGFFRILISNNKMEDDHETV